MKFNRDKLIALTGTVILHVLVLFILLFFGMEHIRSNEEEGLFVNFGTVDEAQGLFEPEGVESATEPTAPEPSTPQTAEETLITQDTEASIALMEKKKAENLAKQKAAEEQRKLEEARKLKAEQERKAAEIRNQTASVFSRSGNQSGDQGNSTGSGNQGSTTGVPETGKHDRWRYGIRFFFTQWSKHSWFFAATQLCGASRRHCCCTNHRKPIRKCCVSQYLLTRDKYRKYSIA